MKVISTYFIFNVFVIGAIALPYLPKKVEVVEDSDHSEITSTLTQNHREKRQFNFARPILTENFNNYRLNQQDFRDQFQQPWHETQRSLDSLNFQLSNSQEGRFPTGPLPYNNYQQLNNGRISSAVKQTLISENYQNQPSYDRNNQYSAGINVPKYIEPQRTYIPSQIHNGNSFTQTSLEPAQRSFIWKEAPRFRINQQPDLSSQRFVDYKQIHFNDPLQPIKFTNKNSGPNHSSSHIQSSPPAQTPSRGPTFSPNFSPRGLNANSPAQAASFYYYTQNKAGLNSTNRQIIPTPQEVLNSALSIGSDIFEKVPGYKLTANTIGFLNNVTRYGANFLANGPLPILGPSSHRPSLLFPFSNPPLNAPPPYSRPKPSQIYPQYEPQGSISAEGTSDTNPSDLYSDPLVAPDEPGTNHGQSESNADNSDKGSHENNVSDKYGSHGGQQSSQENFNSSEKNSKEDRLHTNSESHGSGSQEQNSAPYDYNSPAVASDVLPDEDYGVIDDDDDRIDTKAIKSVLG